jgi:hypothetical protein
MYAAEHHTARLSSPEILLGNWRRTTAMPRLLLQTGIILPMVNYAFAQQSPDPTPMQCQLIRSAAAQYGFAAASGAVFDDKAAKSKSIAATAT